MSMHDISDQWRAPEVSIYSEIVCIWNHSGIQFLCPSVSRAEAQRIVATGHEKTTVVQHQYFATSSYVFEGKPLAILRYETYDNIGCLLQVPRAEILRTDPVAGTPIRFHAVKLMFSAFRAKSVLPSPIPLIDLLLTQITGIFEAKLLFDAFKLTNWHATGQQMFIDKLRYFINRGLPIEMALPAFPCKTSNPEKAANSLPDGAECLALRYLYSFCTEVGKIYEPGCYVDIISDGHVFSDCIGVDDHVVDTYNSKLQAILDTISTRNGRGGIRFRNLGNLLHGTYLEGLTYQTPSVFELSYNVNHPVKTQLCEKNETERALLLRLTSPPAEFLKDVVKDNPEHPLTCLFRGFSRFMFEDLAYHPDYKEASAKQRQKAAEKVAIEMILRNQSYSRLVELVMPNHIRLSIHAHNNAGPKFAIRTLPKYVKHATTTEELIDAAKREGSTNVESDAARETLHIPTPWHNTLVQAGSELFICKAKLAKATGMGQYEKDNEHGRFVIRAQNNTAQVSST